MPPEKHPDSNTVPPDDTAPDDADSHVIYYDEALDDVHDADGSLHDEDANYGRDDARAWKRLAVRPGLSARWLAQLSWHARWLVYLGAFAIPLVMLALLIGLALAFDGDGERDDARIDITATPAGPAPTATFAMTPAWPANLTFAAHTTPARIRNEFSVPGEQHGYRFEGRVGEVWIIAVEPYQNSAADPVLELYGPTGARICHDEGCAAGEPRSQIALVLETGGNYRLLVKSGSGTGTGLYLLTLNDE